MSDRPEPSTDVPQKWRRKGLFVGLLRSHLSLVALGSASFVVALVALFGLEERMDRALNLSEPLVEGTLAVIEGVYAAGGAVNGVVALKRGAYRQEWEAAWDGVIDPALARLEAGLVDETLMEAEEWQALRRRLRDLHEAQWWIFDMVGRHGEEPASYLMSERIRPVTREIERTITSLIENLDWRRPPGKRALSLRRLADLRYRFTSSVTHLEAFIANGLSPAENDYRKAVARVNKNIATLADEKADNETVSSMAIIARLYPRYLAMAERAITLRKGAGWSLTRELMESKARPLERDVLGPLTNLRRKAIARAAETADEAMGAANGVIALSAGFVVLLALAGFFLSTFHAGRIAAPVTALLGTTRRFAKGEQVDDVTPEGYEETVELAGAFNAMRRVVVQKEEDLARSEYRLRALMDQAGDAIFIANRDGRLLEVNQEALRLLNRTADDIPHMTFRDIHPPEAHESLAREFAKMWEEGSVRVDDTFIIRSDGARTPVSISARIVDVGGERIAQGIFRDMTQVKAAEGQADLFRRMVDQAEEIILLVDPQEGRVLYGNQGAARILGYDHKDLPTLSLEEIVVIKDFDPWWRNLMLQEGEWEGVPARWF